MQSLTYHCAECNMALLDLKPADLIAAPPKVDDILVCGACLLTNVVTVTGTRGMTEEEYNSLHPDERRDLAFAKRAVKRNLRNQ